MFRLVRSAFRTADHFVTSGTTRLKKPLENLILKVERNVSTAAHGTPSLSTSFSQHLHAHAYSGARAQPIGSNFSFPTRVTLNRSPLSAPKLPRAPTVPRSIAEVGLGTARNFSSSRHVFQHLVDNVPIHTRALWEVEWELKQKKAAEKKAIRRDARKKQEERIPDRVKAKENVRLPVSTVDEPVDSLDFSTYFAAPANPSLIQGVTTTLTVPLYPAPTRTPLPASDALFPVAELRDLHTAHAAHQTRVTSLFVRLDGAEVWSDGASCECYGGQNSGMVTSLKVVFKGWTKERVRRVLGDAGKGWCELVEEREVVQEQERTPLQPVQSLPDELDVTSSFILPTLDFSSHFASHQYEEAPSISTTRATSPLFMSPPVLSDDEYEHDGWSSGGEEYDRMSDESIAATPIHRSLGFSVNFLERSGHATYDDDARGYF